MTEEGIRDLHDEDAEVDAAVQAALVRQTSDRAMAAIRRFQELDGMGDALAFGHVTDDDGGVTSVGRLSVIDGDEALLIDWRARAAMPFYRATAVERLGVTRRRHLLYGAAGASSSDGVESGADDPGELTGYSDEVFDVDALVGDQGLRGEAAILASVSAPTDDRMRSVVATIQSEQDAVVRAPSDRPLVVQGGPGTGKTVVALHRAAYLLYDQRVELSDTGVLIVGPSPQFLRYIAGVLPSLGESGVVSVTAPELYRGVRRGKPEPPEVAEVKGRAVMAELLARAVRDRQRRPTRDLVVIYGATRARLRVDALGAAFDRAQRYRSHNDGADAFRALVIEGLCAAVFDPSFHNRDDALETFGRSPEVEAFLLRHWPPLTPEQALNDLFGSPALLRLAADAVGLPARDRRLLERDRIDEADLDDARWSDADIPLLDELLVLVGGVMGGQSDEQRRLVRDAADEFELSQLHDATNAVSIELPDVEFDDDDLLVGAELPDTVSLDDPLVDEYGSDGTEYGDVDRPAYEDDRYGYG